MINYGNVANKIFKVLKGNGYSIKTYTFDGAETVDPEEARWFYVVDPNMMVLLDDAEDEIKMNKNATLSLDVYGNVLDQIKSIARHYILNFTIRNFGKEVNPKEFSYMAKKKKKEQEELKQVQESSFSKLRGSQKTSIQALEGVKIVVKHFESVSDDKRGDRSRKIKDIFIEHNGDRQKLPVANLRCARAMARHIQHGGTFTDVLGEHIIQTTLKLKDLVEFTKYTKKNGVVNEKAGELMEMVREGIYSMMNDLDSISKSSSYMSSKCRIESNQTICEQEDTMDIKQMFTSEQIDSRVEKVLPTLGEMMSANKQKMIRIQEASLNTVYCERMISENVGIEYASKTIKLGNNLMDISSNIVENAELSSYIVKIGEKLISEQSITDFEKQIVKNVFENLSVKSKEEVVSATVVPFEDRLMANITESLKSMERKLFENTGDTQFEGYPVEEADFAGGRDDHSYHFYVVVQTPEGSKIDSGFADKEEARQRANEITDYAAAVFHHSRLHKIPYDDANWIPKEVEEGKYTDNAWSQGINNDPEYKFYVLVQTDDGSKIYSGWEYREDAIESLQDTDREGAVVHKPRLAKYGVDANNDKDWMTSDVNEDADSSVVLGDLKASVNGKPSTAGYRAVLLPKGHDNKGEPVVSVEQQIDGKWHGTGGWLLSTLSDKMSDSIWIDHGQGWLIDSGMKAAITNAQAHVAGNSDVIGEGPEDGKKSRPSIADMVRDHADKRMKAAFPQPDESAEKRPLGSLIHDILNVNVGKEGADKFTFDDEAMKDLHDLYQGHQDERNGVTDGQVMRQADKVLQSCRNGHGEGLDINDVGDIVIAEDEQFMEDMDVISDEELNAEFRDLGPRLKHIIDVVKNADTIEEWKYDKSQIELSPSVKQKIMRELETAVFRYHAARQGLGIANKLKDDPSRMKHKRRVMSNLNALRAFVQKLERILKIKD